MRFELQYMPVPMAQMDPYDDAPAPAPPPPPKHPMSFSDLQEGLRDVSTGKTNDNGFRNASLGLLLIVALIALMIHMRQKHKAALPPDSMGKLGREIGRLVRFPLFTRMLLKWVAHTTKVPFVSLLLSAALFDRCVAEWANHNTFSAARRWGKGRLERLRPALFE